ncbi:conserved hypothetical protein [Flavobacterium sp. 9AF]|uniref:hypothetical protein n=1 Tax=Flavobacterium sp. 9AF TaxID=2653142 RepID=UPI0012F049FC|nr:hypothetical protein [Flavobacterium sp. 9AF]VXB58071.1 conserved hypothetical protein [Flavobacterium sp. 9AF]
MSKKTKTFLYNLFGFSAFYIPSYLLIMTFTTLIGFWIAGPAFIISLIFSPKFQYMNTNEGEKIFMKWIFVKGIREVK